MKKLFLIVIFLSLTSTARAEIKDLAYEGKEIYVHVKKEHMTIVLFPEAINRVVRGFGADSYLVQRDNKQLNTIQFVPTDSETAEMTLRGISGEEYVLRFVAKENFYTKLTLHKDASILEKHEEKAILNKMDVLPESIVPNQPSPLNIKITLKGNELPLKIFFSTIAHATGLNIITTPEIDAQKTSINLEGLEVWRALKSLLYKFGYGFNVSKNDLIITQTETRIFNITLPAVDQSFSDKTTNESFAGNSNNNQGNGISSNQQNQDVKVGTSIFYENNSPKLSLWGDLENNVKSMITPQVGIYSINKVSGNIIVTDKPAVLEKISDLVANINSTLSRQQSFEIQIVEVTLSSDYETGIDWNTIAKSLMGLNNITAATNFSSAGFMSGQLFTLSATGPDANSGTSKGGVSMMLKALDAMGQVNVVSRPSITVSNMFPSIIQEVTSIPYISGTGQTIGNNVTQSNVTTSEVSDGLTMRLQAKIEDQKTVLNISVAVNTLDALNTVPVGNGLTIQEPQVSTKSITTNVAVEPGKTLILGGLISTTKNNSTQGVPGLSKIPFLGGAFQYKARSTQKKELVIFITPKKFC